jgi:hypothetical protein
MEQVRIYKRAFEVALSNMYIVNYHSSKRLTLESDAKAAIFTDLVVLVALMLDSSCIVKLALPMRLVK